MLFSHDQRPLGQNGLGRNPVLQGQSNAYQIDNKLIIFSLIHDTELPIVLLQQIAVHHFMEKGVIFIVTGSKKYKEECKFSAKSIKHHNPNLPVKVFTDGGIQTNRFIDEVEKIDDRVHPLKLKTLHLLDSPFEKTLFLDSDTKVEGDLGALFEQLDEKDFVIGKGPLLEWSTGKAHFLDFVHPLHFNTGVFLYTNSKASQEYLHAWNELTQQQKDEDMYPGHLCDQHYFNVLLEKGYDKRLGMRLGIFDNLVYNVRYLAYQNLSPAQKKKVLIKHWHHLNEPLYFKVLKRMKNRFYKIAKNKKRVPAS